MAEDKFKINVLPKLKKRGACKADEVCRLQVRKDGGADTLQEDGPDILEVHLAEDGKLPAMKFILSKAGAEGIEKGDMVDVGDVHDKADSKKAVKRGDLVQQYFSGMVVAVATEGDETTVDLRGSFRRGVV